MNLKFLFLAKAHIKTERERDLLRQRHEAVTTVGVLEFLPVDEWFPKSLSPPVITNPLYAELLSKQGESWNWTRSGLSDTLQNLASATP